MIVCKYCKREFKSNFAFYAHKCEGYVRERLNKKEQDRLENEKGSIVCNGCGRRFKKVSSLRSHARFCENYIPIKRYDENGNFISKSKYKEGDCYKCECGKEFNNPQSFNAHLSHCDYHHEICKTEKKLRPHEINKCMCGWENKSPEEIKEIHDRASRTYSENIKQGKTKSSWCGKRHSETSRLHHRESAIRYRELLNPNCVAAYNPNACMFIDKLNEEKGWHLQHAMNGGEVKLFGYYLDGYDKDLNIVFEYDEPKHYIDVENSILKEKDIERQNYIISKTGCEFYRYNEKKGKLYKVN